MMVQVNMLLSGDADLDITTGPGTAEDWAVHFGHLDCAEAIGRHREYKKHAESAVAAAVALSAYQVRRCGKGGQPRKEQLGVGALWEWGGRWGDGEGEGESGKGGQRREKRVSA